MPKLWNATVETHRRAVRDAILDTTAALAAEQGPTAVTMSQIAAAVGIGRATLYKYFTDVKSILVAWHERQVTGHLHQLTKIRDEIAEPAARLRAVLETYALSAFRHHDTELAALLHRGEHVVRVRRQLHDLIQDLLAEGARAGTIREDVPPGELAGYCLHALTAAGNLPSEDAIHRLVQVTLDGLRPEA